MVSHVRSLPERFKVVIHECGSVYHTGQHFAESVALNLLLSGLTESRSWVQKGSNFLGENVDKNLESRVGT